MAQAEQEAQEAAELAEAEETAAQRWKRRALRWGGALLLLAGIVVAGFFAGIYLRVLDVHEINQKIDLYALPFIGEHFVKPVQKLMEPAPPPEEPAPQEAAPPADGAKKDAAKDLKPKPIPKEEQSRPVLLTQEEIERQQKAAEAAEKKRVSKLARLYNEMKPAAAAEIMADLEDDIAIAVLQKMDEAQAAKVLAAFDPIQSARLTRSMYTGRRASMSSPGDRLEPLRPAEDEEG